MSDTPKHPDVTWAEEISDTMLKMTQCERGIRDLNTGYWGHAAHMLEKVAARADVLERENADLRAKLEEARKDAERFLWMTADHDDVDVRERVVNLCNRLPTMSASAVRMYIDAAIAQGKGEK